MNDEQSIITPMCSGDNMKTWEIREISCPSGKITFTTSQDPWHWLEEHFGKDTCWDGWTLYDPAKETT